MEFRIGDQLYFFRISKTTYAVFKAKLLTGNYVLKSNLWEPKKIFFEDANRICTSSDIFLSFPEFFDLAGFGGFTEDTEDTFELLEGVGEGAFDGFR